ncbi:MAG: CRISPR-associated protein Cas4 [Johnsonella sp.]|nr:CRISPR-associated protein Cas4 [Johnsonella sp.]
MKTKISGVMVNYYFVCPRKLWYFTRDIQMEEDNSLVGMGKLIDENCYSREKKSIMIDEIINIDFIRSWKIIHEVKKSRKLDEAGKWQLKYYIWILRNKGVEIEKGIIDYPVLKQREEVYLTKEEEEELIKKLEEIEKIINLKKAPEVLNKSYCKKCAYYELCYI